MAVSNVPAVIPFDEIVPGATVRFCVKDGVQYLSIRDMIMCVCGKDQHDAAQIWRRMSEHNKDQLCHSLSSHKFPGQGQSEQPVITFRAAIKLVMMLPGKRAQHYRVKFSEIISRYLDGDASLCDEIKRNQLVGKKRSYSKFAQEVDQNIEEDGIDDMPQHQYVYATKSAAFPGLIKIGRTSNMIARLSQLNTGCAPAPHTVVCIVPTLDMYRDECLAHNFFAEFRKEGEFFEVSEFDVKQYFIDVLLLQYQKELTESTLD